MQSQRFIQIGSRILNLDAVRYMEIEGPDLVNVYLTEGKLLQYIEAEAHALLAGLDTGTVMKIDIFGEFKNTTDERIDAPPLQRDHKPPHIVSG